MLKILEADILERKEEEGLGLYLRHPKDWYLIRGYVPSWGGEPWKFAVLPANTFDECFEHDAEKIRTDWDQIVRIPR